MSEHTAEIDAPKHMWPGVVASNNGMTTLCGADSIIGTFKWPRVTCPDCLAARVIPPARTGVDPEDWHREETTYRRQMDDQ